ncbi:hypothetical protein [Flagellimonas sp.]|uniref:hypothetical protein n=1 Tax=Flagellimonas sp. TaxID=2058762 RepID=UPI003BAB180E
MEIGKKFNQFTKEEYYETLKDHKKYRDFNTLGLYRSIIENDKLDIEEKIEIRNLANSYFQKTFNFYQLKDPQTYFELITLNQELTKDEEQKIWSGIRSNQEKILKNKRIKHRNFGYYSKHDCAYSNCPLNGLMVKQGSILAGGHMWFDSDKNRYIAHEKSEQNRKERKNMSQIIKKELEQKDNPSINTK